MNMKIEPILIDLNENGAYTQVAFLVDRQGFLEDIEQIRKKFKINAPFSDNPFDLENQLYSLAGFTPKQVDKARKEHTDAITSLDLDDDSQFKIGYEKIENAEKAEKPIKGKIRKVEHGFREAIAEIRRKYQYPEIFDEVIKQAVLFHKITKFKTAYATYFNPHAARENFSPADTIMAIAVTPYSTEEDIKAAFQDCKDNIREFVEMFSPVYKNMEKDTISNIKRDRKWYWEYKSGNKYKDILDKWNKMCPNFITSTAHPDNQKCQYCDLADQNVIEKAVSRYKKNLIPHKS